MDRVRGIMVETKEMAVIQQDKEVNLTKNLRKTVCGMDINKLKHQWLCITHQAVHLHSISSVVKTTQHLPKEDVAKQPQ